VELLGSSLLEFKSLASTLVSQNMWQVTIQHLVDNVNAPVSALTLQRFNWLQSELKLNSEVKIGNIHYALKNGKEQIIVDALTDFKQGNQVKVTSNFTANSDGETKTVNHWTTIHYQKEKAEIQPKQLSKLAQLADFIKQYEIDKVEIYGHASRTGRQAFNMALSLKRAESVATLLSDVYQVTSDILFPIGKGESELLDTSRGPVANAINRRVEVKLSKQIPITSQIDFEPINMDVKDESNSYIIIVKPMPIK
jgi:outer membrane protein OmpA-like peptidoglycan-associated protein